MLAGDAFAAEMSGSDPILDAALSLAAAGIAVHWLRPKDKIPTDPGWSNAPIYTVDSLKRSYRRGNNVGVRPGEPSDVGGIFLHVMDVDVRDPASANEAYGWLDQHWPHWRDFPTVLSGSGGSSRHIYFFLHRAHRSKLLARSDEHCIYRGRKVWKWQNEIYGSGKNIVAPPSIHPDGGKYRWLIPLDLDLLELGCAPIVKEELLRSWMPKPLDVVDHLPNDNRLGLSIKEIKDILSKLPFDEWVEDRNGWVRCGLALHHEMGAEDGYPVWCEWASQSSKFDEDDSRLVWRSFSGKTEAPFRMASLKAAARATEIAGMFDELGDDPGDEEDSGSAPSASANSTDLESVTRTAAGDLDAGQRFARAYRDKFVHVYSDKRWLRWAEVRWEDCRKGEEVEAAKELAKAMLPKAAMAAAKNPTDKSKAHLAYAVRLNRDGSRLHAVLGMARSVKSLVKLPDEFDSDPMLLGVKNGVLDLRTGRLIPPSPEQLISKQAGAEFRPNATCAKWHRFLEDVLPGSEIRRFVQLCVGYTLTGIIDEEKLFFAHGIGANGKSVFANVVAALMGDYSVTVGAGLLTKSRNEGEAERLVALLPGARLALANETRAGDVWDDKRLKDLASREKISTRRLYSEAFSFMPTHKLWIRGNHLPGVLDDSDGFWRRLVPIAFEQHLPPEKRIADLDRQIIADELPGVLVWALEGCLAWQREGLRIPNEIRKATFVYREDTDILAQWLSECCTFEADARVKVETAYQSYREFCGHQGISAPSKPAFSRHLLLRPGLRRDPSKKHGRRIVGLQVKPAHVAFESFSENRQEGECSLLQ
jgi:putative DNA primase/helicase